MLYLFLRDSQEMETHCTSKNKEASKQVLAEENTGREEGGELRTRLEALTGEGGGGKGPFLVIPPPLKLSPLP